MTFTLENTEIISLESDSGSVEVYEYNIDKFISICLKHKLYHKTSWMLYHWYKSEYNPIKLGLLYIIDGKPVGVCVLLQDSYYSVAAYVRKRHRRKGIATKLVKTAYDIMPGHNKCAGKGIEGSLNFWNKVLYDK